MKLLIVFWWLAAHQGAHPPAAQPAPLLGREVFEVVDPPPRAHLIDAPAPPVKSIVRRNAPWVAAGATVVLVGAAVTSGLLADARFRELRDSCGRTASGCSRADVDALKSRAIVTNVLWGLAVGTAITTGVLFYVDRDGLGIGGRF